MFGVRGDFVVVFVVTIDTAGAAAAAVVVVILFVDVLVVAIVVDIVDVDGALLLITTSTLLSGIDGTFAIETLTSLKRFKWKSNCASAGEKKTIQLFKLNFAKEFVVKIMWKVVLTNTCI